MHSPEAEKLKEFFKAKRFRFAEEIYVQPGSTVVLVSVPVSALSAKAGFHKISKRKLTSLRQQAANDLGLNIEFVPVKGAIQAQIEAGLNALLQVQFPKQIQEAFLSLRGDGNYDLWFEPVDSTADVDRTIQEIKPALIEYLRQFDSKLCQIKSTNTEASLPSISAVLRHVKILAPATAAQIYERIKAGGGNMPSLSWLDRKLDTLRKRNLLLRFEDGKYSLTELGLLTVPHSKNRGSSDIERALALGRRRW